MDRIPFTKEGYEALREELRQLKSVERPRAVKAIAEARAHGDLSENAEYEAAKERQGFVEGRISELEYKLACADVIDTRAIDTDSAVFGCTVVLEDLDSEKEVTYQLVGPEESDVAQGRISVSSPLGRAIVGKRIGDQVTFQAPRGKREYEVVDIQAV